MSKDRDTEQIRLKVRNWLIEQEYVLTPREDPQALWGMVAMVPDQTFGFYIAMFNPHFVHLDLTLPVDHFQKLLDALPPTERRELLYDIRIALLAYDVTFNIPEESFSELRFGADFLKEEVSKFALLKAAGELRRSVLHTSMLLEKKFGSGFAPLMMFSGKIH